ncbi:hypothetical protein C0Q70_17118 [Pomacea canaliculata]|uniref:Uncharacterized protein n=1 Tax=Pomacea canaliculata TaxID=400727 RepID=A0A2T7NRP2_POMCA|nr:hypothetical protein C0Q70_17118 [Pomacea canaliculata]
MRTEPPEDVQAHFLSGSSDNVTVTITWRDVAEVHAVLWCLRPGITSLTCEEEVWWRKVESSRSQFVIGPMSRHSVGHLMYGVASQKSRDHVTVVSGFRWRTCVQERDRDGRVTRVFSCEGNPTAGADDQLTTWVTGSVLFFVFVVAVFTLLCCRAVRERMRKFQQHGFCRPTDPPCLAPRHPGGTHHSHAMRFQDNIRRPPATIPQSHVSGTSQDSLRPTDNPLEGCNGSVSSELQPLTKLPSPAERSRPPSYIQVSIPDDSLDSSEDEETPLNPEALRPLRYPVLETKSWACDVISESTDSCSSVGCSDNSKCNHSKCRSPSASSELQPLTELLLPTRLRGSGSGPMSSTQVSVGDNCEDNREEETVSTSSGDLQYLRYHVTGTKMAASDSNSEGGCSGPLDNHVLTSSSSDGSFVNREDIADDQPTLLVTRYGHVTQTTAHKVDRPPGFAEEALSPTTVVFRDQSCQLSVTWQSSSQGLIR